MPKYVLGIDAGTESIRAAIFDEQGRCLSIGTSPNKNIHKHLRKRPTRWVKISKIIEPDMRKHTEYQFYVDQYVKTYENLKDESRETVRHLEKT